MDNIVGASFCVKRFTSSKDKDFIKALILYNDTIPVDTKTSSNEIMYFADHCSIQPKRIMYFFGLYCNEHLVGFVETGYLLTTKTIIIDYIVLKEEYRLNSVFYPLFSLIQRYFSENMIDYDYIATEVSTKCPEQSVDAESFFSKKMLQMEDFRIAEVLYRQPGLGLDNLEEEVILARKKMRENKEENVDYSEIAYNEEDFVVKINEAFMFDDEILVERFIENSREFNVSVLGNGVYEKVSEVDEPLKDEEVFTFADKYLKNNGNKKLADKGSMANQERRLPAEIDNVLKNKMITYRCGQR